MKSKVINRELSGPHIVVYSEFQVDEVPCAYFEGLISGSVDLEINDDTRAMHLAIIREWFESKGASNVGK